MLALLNSLNAHNFPIFQPNLMIFVSKFMVQKKSKFSFFFYSFIGYMQCLTTDKRRC